MRKAIVEEVQINKSENLISIGPKFFKKDSMNVQLDAKIFPTTIAFLALQNAIP